MSHAICLRSDSLNGKMTTANQTQASSKSEKQGWTPLNPGVSHPHVLQTLHKRQMHREPQLCLNFWYFFYSLGQVCLLWKSDLFCKVNSYLIFMKGCYSDLLWWSCLCFFFSGFITSAAVVQKKVLETFAAGETITLECLISEDHENYVSWFKQSLGEAPTCILSLYADASTPTFYGDFKNDTRLTAVKKNNHFTLIIKDLKPSDTGIYYCGARDYDHITFGNGMFLNYKGK